MACPETRCARRGPAFREKDETAVNDTGPLNQFLVSVYVMRALAPSRGPWPMFDQGPLQSDPLWPDQEDWIAFRELRGNYQSPFSDVVLATRHNRVRPGLGGGASEVVAI